MLAVRQQQPSAGRHAAAPAGRGQRRSLLHHAAAAAAARPRTATSAAATAAQPTPRTASPPSHQRAVVIGSGMAGLAAAEVLSRHFERVTVLERDTPQDAWQGSALDMTQAKGARRGVTQYNMLHGLIAGGLAALDTTVFGAGRYSAALVDAGASVFDGLSGAVFIHPQHGVWTPVTEPHAPMQIAFCSRHVFEGAARRLVAGNARVELQYGACVDGLLFADAEAKAVTGVRLAGGSSIGPCSLVVDCAGRNSHLPQWLQAAGIGAPRVSSVQAGCGYASWYLRLAPEAEAALAGKAGVFCMAVPPERSMGLLFRVEDGRWMVGVGGYGDELMPPHKDEQLEEYVQQVTWHPAFAQLLAGSTRLAPACRFYRIQSNWRHYEELSLPEGLLVMADSVCSFSPVYGQGMGVAAMEAAQLAELLAKRQAAADAAAAGRPDSGSEPAGSLPLHNLSRELQAAMLPTIQTAWDLSAGNDVKFGALVTGWPEHEQQGGSLLSRAAGGFMDAYTTALFGLAARDKQVHQVLTRVMQMQAPPAALMAPAVLGRVVRHWLGSAAAGLFAGPGDSGDAAAGGAGRSSARARVLLGDARFDLGLAWPAGSAAAGSDVPASSMAGQERQQQAAAQVRRRAAGVGRR